MKQHLAGVKGNTDACSEILGDVRFKILNALKKIENKKKKHIVLDDMNDGPEIQNGDGDDIEGDVRPSQKRKKKDGWKDTKQPLVNFLVYIPKGITFLKSVDASNIYASAENLCNLFAELVGMVGSENVVHFVTNSAPNYKAAGKLLAEKKRPGWREIIQAGETRFATTFISLQSLYQHKEDLQALVTSTYAELKQLFKTSKAKDAKLIILDERLWNECLIIVKIMTPIIRLLRICDADEKPSLSRWNRMLRHDLHAAAYYLNPSFMYDQTLICEKPEVMSGLMSLIGKQSENSKTKLVQELRFYREREGSFSPDMALTCSKTSQPEFWIIEDEEEEEGELEYDELENALAEEYPKDHEDAHPEKSNDVSDFDEDFTMPAEEYEGNGDRDNQDWSL
ncbi:PREDICTED: uncharacterized protein LOC104710400 [Camelina sativa]|uniref:Uncharacterized protein LOC104710400 n=1 Tax=Camelina sativa TaxID=90675 RepID=A0ABM0TER2_CAMSA|nr:PREDICTED: uncharacterized protein LOC104710400 [Camelina sativa]